MEQLISKEDVSGIIEKADKIFNECFTMLLHLKHGSDDLGDILMKFQPTLANGLDDLMKFYQKLISEKKELISSKHKFEKQIFAEKMNSNKIFLNAIREAIEIGKSLGDAFAWFFYQKDRDELDKQFQHNSTGLFVTGVGGKGEMEFITNISEISGCYVLYHSITNILRIGDFSLYAAKNGIVGTGELKTKKIEDTINVTASIVSKINLDISNKENKKIVFEKNFDNELKKDFPNIKKQLQIQEELLKIKPCDYSVSQGTTFEYNLIDDLSKDTSIVINNDNSLLLYAVWCKKTKLCDILMEQEEVEQLEETLEEKVKEIVLPNNPYNEIVLGEIVTQMSILRIPILWWDIKDDICRDIYFKKVCITSIFNPAKMLDLFVKEGFEIENFGNLSEIKIGKKSGQMHIGFEHFDSICDLVNHSLMKTEDAFSFLQKAKETFQDKELLPNSKMEMHIHLDNFGKR